ncbi:MAG: NAD(P)-dependent alcohol dehydrogenase [Rhodobacteraceae bacterium]|nr:NAD(P)-dependent alcohol dehydrogenase [Paracoccaceae bacterium]
MTDVGMMKAAVIHRFGGPEVVTIGNVPVPVPGKGQVRVRVVTTTVSTADWRLRSRTFPAGFAPVAGLIFGWRRPRRSILGTELAGIVDAAGPAVSRFAEGDAVVAQTGMALGAHAEYAIIAEDGPIVRRPAGLSWPEAAAMSFGGTTALHALKTLARVAPGERVLVTGASGAVGSAAVQIAGAFGARVTGVASAANRDVVLGLGAQEFIDYLSPPILQPGSEWDVILDCVGVLGWRDARRSLAAGGRFIAVVSSLYGILGAALGGRWRGRRMFNVTTPETRAGLEALAQLIEDGAFRPLVGAVVPLDRIAEAHAMTDSGHKKGSVVVAVTSPPGEASPE